MATKKKMKDGDKKFSIGLSGGGQATRKGAGGSVGGSASFNFKNGVRATVSGGGGVISLPARSQWVEEV